MALDEVDQPVVKARSWLGRVTGPAERPMKPTMPNVASEQPQVVRGVSGTVTLPVGTGPTMPISSAALARPASRGQTS